MRPTQTRLQRVRPKQEPENPDPEAGLGGGRGAWVKPLLQGMESAPPTPKALEEERGGEDVTPAEGRGASSFLS